MKLMIEIPKEDYIHLRDEGMFGNVTTFKRAVREGIPLEQEPSEDAVKYFDNIYKLSQTCGVTYDFIFDRVQEIETMIKTLPPVTPAEKQQPCEDCISRQAVEDAIADMVVNGESLGYAVAYDILSDLPPVKPQQKMGKWIRVDKDKCKCDQCEVISFIAMYPNGDKNYCPNCGAKMQEVQK